MTPSGPDVGAARARNDSIGVLKNALLGLAPALASVLAYKPVADDSTNSASGAGRARCLEHLRVTPASMLSRIAVAREVIIGPPAATRVPERRLSTRLRSAFLRRGRGAAPRIALCRPRTRADGAPENAGADNECWCGHGRGRRVHAQPASVANAYNGALNRQADREDLSGPPGAGCRGGAGVVRGARRGHFQAGADLGFLALTCGPLRPRKTSNFSRRPWPRSTGCGISRNRPWPALKAGCPAGLGSPAAAHRDRRRGRGVCGQRGALGHHDTDHSGSGRPPRPANGEPLATGERFRPPKPGAVTGPSVARSARWSNRRGRDRRE